MKALELKRPLVLAAAVGFVAGVIWFVALRLVTYQSQAVHYHANFAVFIDGQREPFDSFVYYEEITQCSADSENPARRVHMHDNINDVIHVHDKEATWGHFFANLGWTLGDNLLATRSQAYTNDVVFVLNGQEVSSLANQVINSEDQLLIDVNGDPSTRGDRRAALADTAGEYNSKADPSTCSGSEDDGITTRLKNVLGL